MRPALVDLVKGFRIHERSLLRAESTKATFCLPGPASVKNLLSSTMTWHFGLARVDLQITATVPMSPWEPEGCGVGPHQATEILVLFLPCYSDWSTCSVLDMFAQRSPWLTHLRHKEPEKS